MGEGWARARSHANLVVMPEAPRLDDTSAAPVGDVIDRVRLVARDYRGLRELDWDIEPGVSLLVGPNGSGKTSVLSALAFLGTAYEDGVGRAVQRSGAASALRRLGAAREAPVTLGLEVGPLRWELQLGVEGPSIHPNPGERLTLGERVLLERPLHSAVLKLHPPHKEPFTWDADQQTGLWLARKLGLFKELDDAAGLDRLDTVLRTRRAYFGFWPDRLREAEKEPDQDGRLHSSGSDLYGVLRSWMSAPRRFDGQFDWVVGELRRAFPDQVEGIEFDAVGRLVDARFFPPSPTNEDGGLPLSVAANGLLVGLALLTAVAGAAPHSILAIDELENHLHPHAIRSILAAMRSRAEARDLRIIVTTHSPVVMNAFRDEPERLYVIEPGLDVVPKPLTELRNPDWLAHFALGDLYEREKFAAPRPTG